MSKVITSVRRSLKAQASSERKEKEQRFFKEPIKLYGVPMASVHQIAKTESKQLVQLEKHRIWEECESLWKSGYLEEGMIACDWAYMRKRDSQANDMSVFEKWIKLYVNNWAVCDTLCNHTVGAFLEMYPDKISVLKKWAKSRNRWLRRAAAVALIIPARKGLFLPDIFEIADLLLRDKDDLVQKGYGWMLKAASEFDQHAVFEWVMRYKKEMPRTALRYAIEKMSPSVRKQAMAN